MPLAVLTYHSHHVVGPDYAENDHVALARDLDVLTDAGWRIVPLAEIVRLQKHGTTAHLCAITFDDGPVYDVDDVMHPAYGVQAGFANVMRAFAASRRDAQPQLHATSFVIASPEARRAMELSPDCGYPEMPDWLGERWWSEAIDSGLMAIGNHSWDHVHHAVDRTAIASPVRDDFTRVDNYTDADREIRAAGMYINARVGGRCELFAFPFGHANEYLVNEYLPQRGYEHGMVAAFGTGGRAVAPGDSVWNIPRLVCGEHWSKPEGLGALLAA